MKKLLTVLLIAAFCTGLQAQTGRNVVHPDALYGSVDLGAAIYSHNGETTFGMPAFGIAGGYWIANPIAFQIGIDGIFTSNAKNHEAMFLLADAEIKWDVNYTFFHVYNERFLKPIPIYPLLGLGLMWHYDLSDETVSTENSFQAMLGFQLPIRINPTLDAKFEYKCFFLPQGFDGSPNDNFLHTLGLGLNFRKRPDPYHRRTENETRSIADDWFLGAGIGVNYSAFDLFTNPNLGGTSMIGIAPEVMVGRNFSSFWTLRMELTGLTAHEVFDTITSTPKADYSFTMLHADIMANVVNMFGMKRGLKWNFLPYIGAGIIWRYDNLKFDMALDYGIMSRRYLTQHSDIYFDLRYVMVPANMVGNVDPSGNSLGVGLPSFTVGYIYNFGRSTTRYRQSYNCAD